MIPNRYKYYIEDYKLIVEHNKAHIIFICTTIFLTVFPVFFFVAYTNAKINPDKAIGLELIGLFNFLFWGWFFWKKYQQYADPIILIVDSQTKTIELKNKRSGNRDVSYRDVVRIEISPEKSGSYVYDYLKIILNDESLKVIRAKGNAFSSTKSMTDALAQEIATWTGKGLERK